MGRSWPRRSAVASLTCAGAALGVAATALAAHPLAGAKYLGSGKQYFNNAPCPKHPKQQCYRSLVGHQRFSFTVTRARRHAAPSIVDFVAPYDFYCGGGHAVARPSRPIAVRPDGAFAYRFRIPAKGLNGKVVGTTTFTLGGRFVANGRTARLSYTVATRFSAGQRFLCGTRVTGLAHAVGR
jgi:hypothetical protein